MTSYEAAKKIRADFPEFFEQGKEDAQWKRVVEFINVVGTSYPSLFPEFRPFEAKDFGGTPESVGPRIKYAIELIKGFLSVTSSHGNGD